MKIKVLRQKNEDSEPYWECFDYDGGRDISVAGLLHHLNYHDDIVNDKGDQTERIRWECSCLQGLCGGCAMVINGMPALACECFLKDLKSDVITIRPLRKFPVICDLIVDRTMIHENLKEANVFIGEYRPKEAKNARDDMTQYNVAKCLKCGLCLEVCPNYTNGKTFFGAVFANDSYLVTKRNRDKSADIAEIYGRHVGSACSKALSCMDVCPMKIETIAYMAELNRIEGKGKRKR